MTSVSGGTEWPERYCSLCWATGREHINQQWVGVDRHQHQGNDGLSRCPRPWSALCQNEHGDICHASDHPTHTEAITRLDQHIRAGKHIELGSSGQPPETPCTRERTTP